MKTNRPFIDQRLSKILKPFTVKPLFSDLYLTSYEAEVTHYILIEEKKDTFILRFYVQMMFSQPQLLALYEKSYRYGLKNLNFGMYI